MARMIEFEDLSFTYAGRPALHGASARLEAGEAVALVGPNGAGKTTLLRCLAALEPPETGWIRIRGTDAVADPAGARRHAGFLQDLFGLHDRLSVKDALRHAAALRGIRDDLGAAEDAAARAGISALMERPCGALSRGQRQRVGIAQAIVHRPAVLLLDEPSSGLDPEARADLSALLRALRAEGMGLIVSSHILSELESYATRMIVLAGGRIRHDGPVSGGRTRILLHGGGDPRPILAAAGLPEGEATEEGWRIPVVLPSAEEAALVAGLVAAGVAVRAVLAEPMQEAYLAALREEIP